MYIRHANVLAQANILTTAAIPKLVCFLRALVVGELEEGRDSRGEGYIIANSGFLVLPSMEITAR